MRLSASTIKPNGRTARPTCQNTSALTSNSSSAETITSCSTLSHASSTARDALERTTSLPPGNSIACIEGGGAISASNQSGASRPDLYGDGGER